MAAAVVEEESPEFRLNRRVEAESSSSAESSFRELDDAFLQTQTRIWLGEVLQTRFDEQTSISDLLADGQLLFQVSEVIQMMLMTTSTDSSHLQFLEGQSPPISKNTKRYQPYFNVAAFLRVCQILGLSGIDLFTPSDVVEKKDARKVCMCIRLFSKKARSRNLKVPDFDIVTYSVVMPTDMVECIRRSLELSQDSPSMSLCSDTDKGSLQELLQRESGSAFGGYGDTPDSHMTESLMIPDCPVVGDGAFSVVELSSHVVDKQEVIEGQYTPKSITESVGSLCSHDDDLTTFLSCIGSHINDEEVQEKRIPLQDSGSGVRNHIPFHIGDYEEYTSDLVNFGDRNSEEADDTFHDMEDFRTCNGSVTSFASSGNMYFALDEEDSHVPLEVTHPSHGMGCRSGSIESVEDADCVSCVSDSGLSLDSHHNREKNDQFMVGDIQSYLLFESLMDEFDTLNMVKQGNLVGTFTCDIEEVDCDLDLEDSKPFDKHLLPSVHLSPSRDSLDRLMFDTGLCAVDNNGGATSFDENASCETMDMVKRLSVEVHPTTAANFPNKGDQLLTTINARNELSAVSNVSSDRTAIKESVKCQETDDQDSNNENKLLNISDKYRDDDSQVPDKIGIGEPKLATSIFYPRAGEHLGLVTGSSEYTGHKDHQDPIAEEVHQDKAQLLEEDDTLKPAPKHNSRGKFLIQVVKGTAVAGVLLLLLHMRGNRREEAGKANKPSGRDSHDGSVGKGSSQNSKEGVGGNNIYPGGKLQFGEVNFDDPFMF